MNQRLVDGVSKTTTLPPSPPLVARTYVHFNTPAPPPYPKNYTYKNETNGCCVII